MVDIDGVISLFGVPEKDDTPDTPRGSLHSVDGTVHFLSATAAAHLLGLSQLFELVWASGWEERADEHLPRLLGLPAGLPFCASSGSPETRAPTGSSTRSSAIAGDRSLAWIDDVLDDACHRWAAAREAPDAAGGRPSPGTG